MKQFIMGQRWISESEPELGLGVIVEVEAKTVTCFFPAAKVDRRYGSMTAPLRRIRFILGDEVKSQTGDHFIVESVSNVIFLFGLFVSGTVYSNSKL
jgi:ATP-dependent helicase HepA